NDNTQKPVNGNTRKLWQLEINDIHEKKAPMNNDKELATALANYVPDTKNKRAKVNISKLQYNDTKNRQLLFNTPVKERAKVPIPETTIQLETTNQ
ncbi:18909_t:CDS:2, partial [Gigaspora margarita]